MSAHPRRIKIRNPPKHTMLALKNLGILYDSRAVSMGLVKNTAIAA
jgi:hypothetical protein